MSDEIKVSIILPIYNVEKYLDECLRSLTGQTLNEIEIICINDGSTDSSLEILEKNAEIDNRIKVITKKNEGVSIARNDGVKIAKGEYIFFVDPDDFIDTDYCRTLYSTAKKYNADLVLGGIKKYYSPEKIKHIVFFKEFSDDEKKCIKINESNLAHFFSKGYKDIVTSCGRLIRRKMIEDNKILIYKERTSEDLPYTSLNFLYAKTVSVDESVNYYYRQGVSFSLSKKTDIIVKDVLIHMKILKEDVIDRGFGSNKDILRIIDLAVCDVLIGYYDMWNVGNFTRCSLSTIKKLYPEIKNTYIDFFNIKEIVNDSENKALEFKYKFLAFGVKHNIYIMPKILRFLRNILRSLPFIKNIRFDIKAKNTEKRI